MSPYAEGGPGSRRRRRTRGTAALRPSEYEVVGVTVRIAGLAVTDEEHLTEHRLELRELGALAVRTKSSVEGAFAGSLGPRNTPTRNIVRSWCLMPLTIPAENVRVAAGAVAAVGVVPCAATQPALPITFGNEMMPPPAASVSSDGSTPPRLRLLSSRSTNRCRCVSRASRSLRCRSRASRRSSATASACLCRSGSVAAPRAARREARGAAGCVATAGARSGRSGSVAADTALRLRLVLRILRRRVLLHARLDEYDHSSALHPNNFFLSSPEVAALTSFSRPPMQSPATNTTGNRMPLLSRRTAYCAAGSSWMLVTVYLMPLSRGFGHLRTSRFCLSM